MSQKDTSNLRVKKRKRTMKLRTRIYILLLLLTACFGVYFCMESPVFNIDHIAVNGNVLTDAENIIKVSNIYIGENIFKINSSKNEEYIEGLYYIKSAKIKKVFPASIVIEVEEKEPILIINDGGNYIYVDDELTVIKEQSSTDNSKIPLLSNLTILSSEPGQKVEAEKTWILDMIYNMALNLKEVDVLKNVSEFYISDDNIVHLYTKGGSVIKITNQKIFESNFQFIYTILSEDNIPMSVELMENGNHIYKQIN
jgi:cell division protein FtsQ